MKYLDEFRDPELARRLLREIRERTTKRWTLMEVCGGQTHSLLRHGIDAELCEVVELIHGPGCPVCVTPVELIDQAQRLAMEPQVLVTTFADMLRVPGSQRSLQETRALGGNIRAVYGPLDAVRLAREDRLREVVFFAVGFETTAPATALALRHAIDEGLRNFSILAAHVRVLPVMEMLARDARCRVEAFLAAGHVCTITGMEAYHQFAADHHLPVAVTGFEPLDLLVGIQACIDQLEQGVARAVNCYPRSVESGGNLHAQRMVESVYEIADMEWRGMGLVRQGGYRLRDSLREYDAERRFGALGVTDRLPIVGSSIAPSPPAVCLSGDVLAGRIKPSVCPSFGRQCRPEHPVGAPMVSSEGACAAYFRYAAAEEPWEGG